MLVLQSNGRAQRCVPIVVVVISVFCPLRDMLPVGWFVFTSGPFVTVDGMDEAVIAGAQSMLLGTPLEGVAVRSSEDRVEVTNVELGAEDGSVDASDSA